MKGRLLVKIAGIAGAVALLAGATFGFFTSNAATITGVSLASANPALEVYDPVTGWGLNADNVGLSAADMYPGWEGSEQTFYLRNVTGGGVPFGSIFPAIVAGAVGDWNELKNVVEMRFGETGTGWSTGWASLEWWFTTHNDNILLSNLVDPDQREFSAQFRMDASADDSAKDKTLTFTLSFVAQTP